MVCWPAATYNEYNTSHDPLVCSKLMIACFIGGALVSGDSKRLRFLDDKKLLGRYFPFMQSSVVTKYDPSWYEQLLGFSREHQHRSA